MPEFIYEIRKFLAQICVYLIIKLWPNRPVDNDAGAEIRAGAYSMLLSIGTDAYRSRKTTLPVETNRPDMSDLPEWWTSFEKRIIDVEGFIKEEITDQIAEGYTSGLQQPLSPASVKYASTFAAILDTYDRPAIFGMLNGEIRLVWQSRRKDDKNNFSEQVGLKFLDDGRVQYVCFRREINQSTSIITGYCHLDMMLPLIIDLELDHVMMDQESGEV